MDGHSAPDPAGPRPRPRSYLSARGVLVTDFPVHDGPGQVPAGESDGRSESLGQARGGEPEASGASSPRQRRAETPPTPGPPRAAADSPGPQQLIPRALASEPHRRLQKVRSLVDALAAAGPGPVAPSPRALAGPELDSPGSLRRGLRSTSYRRAVVSGLDLDSTSTSKKNRMSQPALKAVAEDRERFASLVRIKKKMLKGQETFDGEGNSVLYQKYKEKALDADSEEESESNGQKADESTMVHPKPAPAVTWSQLSAVRRNGLSQTLSQEERKRQEAILEVISSERSYLLSLHTLIRMFKDSQELGQTMTKTERHHLFSNITDVCEASKRFFMELEARHHSGTFIDDISDIVEKHAASAFEPYVRYCTNEAYQQRTLQRLLDTNPPFKEVLARIEAHEDCRNLPIISFLILPMQRVTRLPLLMDTICQKTPKDSPKYDVCRRALREASKLVRLCNEGARKMERTELLCTINSQLEFRIKPFPLVSASRWLVKRGELTAFAEDAGLFSRRPCRHHVYFFLFNDVLIITKRKSEESYVVTDYSLRDQLLVECCDGEEPVASPSRGSPATLHSRLGATSRLFTLTVLSNHVGERVQLLLGAETQSERARWIWALGQSSRKPPPDRASLTQVEIIRSFTAKQPDELSLQVADVVLIHQRVGNGWYEGERLRDAERGWFPMECAREITCQATVDKNVEQMGRLLSLETHV